MAKLKYRSISGRTVDALGVEKDTVFWDRELPGFGVRVYPSGSKVYIVQTRGPEGPKRVTVGRHGVITANQARRRAAAAIVRIKAGEDPGLSPAPRRKSPTVAEVASRFLREHVEVRCKPGTVVHYRTAVDRHIVPALGGVQIGALTPKHVADLHYGLRERPYTANHAVDTLSQLIRQAAVWGLVPEGANPCRQVQRYRQDRRERFLTDIEFRRLGRVLDEMEAAGEAPVHVIAAIRLLMLTGCRRNEIMTLRWEDVDLGAGELRLRDTKTGPRVVSLSPAAAEVLAAVPRLAGNPWVIVGSRPGQRLSSPDNHWFRIRARAELEDVRLHDLRHSFASRALSLGESLPVIAKLLGHSQIKSAARYAHLGGDAVKEAAARVADAIGANILPDDLAPDGTAAAVGSDGRGSSPRFGPGQFTDINALVCRSASKSGAD